MSAILSANYIDTIVVEHLFWVKIYFSSYDLKRHIYKVAVDKKTSDAWVNLSWKPKTSLSASASAIVSLKLAEVNFRETSERHEGKTEMIAVSESFIDGDLVKF